MNWMLAFAAVAAATAQSPAAPPPIPDSAATLVPISLEELRHFADALAVIAAREGATPAQALSPTLPATALKMSHAERAQIMHAHGLSPARFDYIATQVRYNDRMARVVREELVVASREAP